MAADSPCQTRLHSGAAVKEMQCRIAGNSARQFSGGTNRIREGHSSSLLLRHLQKCSGEATKPGAEQAGTGWEIPDVWGGLRGCPVVKLCWNCPIRKLGHEGTEVYFYRPLETSRSRHTKEKIFKKATCKSWVISRSWKSRVKCCYQTLDSAAITVYKNENRARDKLTEPKPK